jgi:uncharacterized protein (TIGR02246 family)
MAELEQLRTWVESYVRAWNSNDPDEIGALFTEDARYFTEPYTAPWAGRQQIVEQWLERRDEPGETTFDWHPVAVTADACFVQGTTTYPDRTFSNLWDIRLDGDGQCREFTEWWMQHPAAG